MTEDPNEHPHKAAPSDNSAQESAHKETTPHAAPSAGAPSTGPTSEPSADAAPSDETPLAPPPTTAPSGAPPLVLRWAPPADTGSPPRLRVDPEDIRMALEEQAKKRPPRPPVNELLPPIPKLKVDKPRFRKHKP